MSVDAPGTAEPNSKDSKEETKSKEVLEKEKLSLEIANLRATSTWYFPLFQTIKLTEWLTMLAAVVLAVGGWWTGIFNATRISLDNQRDKLEKETATKEAELNAKTKELEELKKRLEPLQYQEEALAYLRSMKHVGFRTTFSVDQDFENTQITFHYVNPNPAFKPPIMREAIKAATKFRNLKELRFIGHFSLSDEDLASATQNKSLTSLAIWYAQLDAVNLKGIRSNSPINSLNLHDIRGLKTLAMFPTLKSIDELRISENQFEDEGLRELSTRFPNVTHLDLKDCNITDKEIPDIRKMKELRRLNLSGTKITLDGILSLTQIPTLDTLYLEKARITPHVEMILKKNEARFKVVEDGNLVSWLI